MKRFIEYIVYHVFYAFSVEVDRGRLETSRFKKCCANCVLLYFPSTEFKSAFNVYTDTVEELPGYPVQNSPSGSFLFWGGPVGRGGIVYDIVWRRCPRRTPGWCCVHLCARILSSSLTSVSIFSVCCYSIVSISMDLAHVCTHRTRIHCRITRPLEEFLLVSFTSPAWKS